jgi:hypothetical protein
MLVYEAVQQKDQEPHSCIKCLAIGVTGKNVAKTWSLLQTTGGKDEQNIVAMRNGSKHHNTKLRM